VPAYNNQFPPTSLFPGDSAIVIGIVGTVALLATDGLIRVNGVVTGTTTAAHNFVPGQVVDIEGVGTDSGLDFPYGFNGQYVILTVPTTTTFTYNDPAKQNDQGDGGSATSVQGEQLAGASARITLPMEMTAPAPGIGVELMYTAAAGAAESVAIQEAYDDDDPLYITPSNTAYTMAITALLVATSDLIPTGGRFIRLNRTKGANNVNVVAKIFRVN
jgi:hypothetical protein